MQDRRYYYQKKGGWGGRRKNAGRPFKRPVGLENGNGHAPPNPAIAVPPPLTTKHLSRPGIRQSLQEIALDIAQYAA